MKYTRLVNVSTYNMTCCFSLASVLVSPACSVSPCVERRPAGHVLLDSEHQAGCGSWVCLHCHHGNRRGHSHVQLRRSTLHSDWPGVNSDWLAELQCSTLHSEVANSDWLAELQCSTLYSDWSAVNSDWLAELQRSTPRSIDWLTLCAASCHGNQSMSQPHWSAHSAQNDSSQLLKIYTPRPVHPRQSPASHSVCCRSVTAGNVWPRLSAPSPASSSSSSLTDKTPMSRYDSLQLVPSWRFHLMVCHPSLHSPARRAPENYSDEPTYKKTDHPLKLHLYDLFAHVTLTLTQWPWYTNTT